MIGYDKAYFKQIKKDFTEKYGAKEWKKVKKKLTDNPCYIPHLGGSMRDWWIRQTQLKERIEFMGTKLGRDIFYTLIYPEIHGEKENRGK